MPTQFAIRDLLALLFARRKMDTLALVLSCWHETGLALLWFSLSLSYTITQYTSRVEVDFDCNNPGSSWTGLNPWRPCVLHEAAVCESHGEMCVTTTEPQPFCGGAERGLRHTCVWQGLRDFRIVTRQLSNSFTWN